VATLLGIPVDQLLVALSGVCLCLLLALAVATSRRPLLVRLAVRYARRRLLQAALITLGLGLSTIITSTALNTGDLVSQTIRSLVAGGLGRADEVVLALPRDQRRSMSELMGALLNGSLLTGLGQYFPEARAKDLALTLAGDSRVAGLLPAIGEQVTVVDLDQHTVRGQASLLAMPPNYPTLFGQLSGADGEDLDLTRLQPGEVLANADAAAQLQAQAGTTFELRTRDGPLRFRVAGVSQTAGPGGSQPTLYAQLADYQERAGRRGMVNQLLVANRGDPASSVLLSGEVSAALRVGLADRAAAAETFALLRSDGPRAQIASAARDAEGRQREKLQALSRALEAPDVSDTFISLATDPEVERRLFTMVARLSATGSLGELRYREISPLRVLEVKQAAQDQADRWGGALTTTFFILGLFSLATGVLLVVLIFFTLAGERSSELGILRALGARRLDLIVAFVLEGAVYDSVGSLLGLGIGLALTAAIAAAGDAALRPYGLELTLRLEPRSLALAYLLGLLLTAASVGYAAWRTSQLSIVEAIRGSPPAVRRRRLLSRTLRAMTAPTGLLLGWLGVMAGVPAVQALGVGLFCYGVARAALTALGRDRPGRDSDRVVYSVAGLALLAYWLAPPEWPFVALIRPLPRSLEVFFLAGVSLVLGATWLLLYNFPLIAQPLVWATEELRALALAIRTAVASPLQHRLRTGLIVAMYALVIFSMVLSSVLLTATHRAYSDPEALSGGFDVRAEVARPDSLPDLLAAIGVAGAVSPDDFQNIGRLASRAGQVIELSAANSRWRAYPIVEIDSPFPAGIRTPLAARAAGYVDDDQVWRTLFEQPGFAVAAGSAVVQTETSQANGFRFERLSPSDGPFEPVRVWVRDERSGRSAPLTVIGVMDPRLSFGSGLYTSAVSVQTLAAPPAQRVVYYLKARDGADPTQLAQGLNISFSSDGLRATALGEEARRIQSIRVLLNQLLQSFFGIGLLAGLAALGLISLRVVVERRRQIGILRALGFKRHQIRVSMLLETGLIALLGIGLGNVLGLALARRVTEYLARQFPEILFSVPWDQLLQISGGALLAALLMTVIPLVQIGRIEPATALTFE
jgi:putative ABC transport system permease protein